MSNFAPIAMAGCASAVLASLLCTAASAAAPSSPPDFSPNASVSWVASWGGFKPPVSGEGPIRDDPAYPTINNDDAGIELRHF
jgi:hypothetical protein